MTYEEAEIIISKEGEYFYRNGKKWKRVITPCTGENFIKFQDLLYLRPDAKDYLKTYVIDNCYNITEYRVDLLAGEIFNI